MFVVYLVMSSTPVLFVLFRLFVNHRLFFAAEGSHAAGCQFSPGP